MSSIVLSPGATGAAAFTIEAPSTATSRVITLPDATDTLVGKATTDTLTNKTLTSPVLDTAVTGTAVATQAQQETAAATNVLVTPGRQQFHPSAAKAWGQAQTNGILNVGFNIGSLTDVAVGRVVFNLTTAFSSASYAAVANAKLNTSLSAATTLIAMIRNDSTASAIHVDLVNADGTAFVDPNYYLMAAFGDQ